MEKKVSSNFQPRKCQRKEQQLDRISQLPNEIIVYILSLLTLEDAAKTSILSKRWVNLWMNVTRLDFDSAKMWKRIGRMEELPDYFEVVDSTRSNYVEWVNKVLQSHKAIVLDVFRIRFDLDKCCKNDIDKWLQFALARRVHRLEFNFLDYDGDDTGNEYDFPHDLLCQKDGNSSALSLPDSCKNGIISDAKECFKSLRTLMFNCVNVSGEVLEHFLHNCPFLEYLLVESSHNLVNFKVCGPSLALKHLEIIFCPNLRSLTVCNTNIVSLKTSHGNYLVLKNVPMLVDVCVGGLVWGSNGRREYLLSSLISWLSCCLSSLEVLSLDIKEDQVLEEVKYTNNIAIPQLTKLKQLTFYMYAPCEDKSLIALTSLIRASPNLEKFVLKYDQQGDSCKMRRVSKKGIAFPLTHLRIVELWGYSGRRTQIELVEYFVENGVVLERVIIEPRDFCYKGLHVDNPKGEAKSRKCAEKQLTGLLPDHVELVIL